MQSALASEVSAPFASGKAALVVRPGQPVQRVMRIEPTARDVRAEASPEDLMAFVRLFEQFGPRVKSYLIRQGADRATAEDPVQDVMLTVWRRAVQFDRSKATFSTWVLTMPVYGMLTNL